MALGKRFCVIVLLLCIFYVSLSSAEPRTGLTKAQIKEIIDAHNAARRDAHASDMYLMKWDWKLAAEAYVWARECRGRYMDTSHGQLMSLTTSYYGPVGDLAYRAITDWQSGKYFWNYEPVGRDFSTLDYTQMIWSTSKSVGCGVEDCRRMTILFCLYSPAGNRIGHYPFTKGAACSKCPAGTTCDDGLCAW